ncbi:hypothetical protein GT204_20660 [Streptomyces sp. SID4919]|uniref:hypothetical protein n=1 Tax=unclassified Streptomyces TaxID=2593676 RepID=UPI000823BDF1|nr:MULTISPECIES: hypothetical protein [unclassified Streptomyces]MYY11252.1 hypothetical protein [Streptomyces sp. SID4919]SCK16904.1 hypothetical protein YW7DRAFT_01149 [Streptomyces sp. AmelKG-E11A]
MSRETDSSSSGPQGRGGAAYPSGTPPYGTPTEGGAAAVGADNERQSVDAPAEDRKTETTLTTRVRINIPGSRPIPPVVMRTPVSDINAGPAAEPDTGATRLPGAPAPGTPGPAAPPGPGAPGEPGRPDKTSEWFAPRKSGAPRGGPGTPEQNGTGEHGGSPAALPAAPAQRTPPPAAARPGARSPATGGGNLGGLPVGGPQSQGGDLPYFTPGPPEAGPEATGELPRTPGAAAPRMSDDTAILTPQQLAPLQPGAPGGPLDGAPGGPGENVSGHTLTSGIPVVPAARDDAFPSGPAADGTGPRTPPRTPEPPAGGGAKPAAPRPKKKGRSKLVMLCVLLVVAAGGTYGAGLLLNHSDVPKGTTVLGVDIGGGTRDEAVKKLEAALGERIAKPLQLSVDGENVPLRPDQSGLTLDTAATVASAAGSDYHPVSVVTSLFGEERVVSPEMPVDTEKLQVQLERAAGAGTGAGDGTIRFEPGKAVAVYGKPGKGIDVKSSLPAVEEAYRTQVRTGRSTPVRLAVTDREPTISKAEVDRMMKDFARPAMSGLVKITAGGQGIPFGPDLSLPKIIGVKAVDGKLVDTYDLKALEELYGSTFDGVLITRGTGEKTPVTPQDVAVALKQALRATGTERTVDIPLNPS